VQLGTALSKVNFREHSNKRRSSDKKTPGNHMFEEPLPFVPTWISPLLALGLMVFQLLPTSVS
jgi:hypothetical protein